ncbi:DUF917 domain-containing protein [Gordonia sp. C13]|uniref:DUF917 domain-containing protein n=1 Tax=Gordonia sp. C13 TaxID=2935078 RepID=UPI00200A907F|nr:DUF917 domain-containing protein [Gordonia sp. C13]MCK8615321.1 DUF917 domain-containing protein [Gordonia sp. C13]
MHLDSHNLDAYAVGCGVLSTGGGGEADIGMAMVRLAIESFGAVEIIDVVDLGDDDLVMPCGLIGSPTLARERLWNGTEGDRLATIMNRLHDGDINVLMCYEIAGVNGLLPAMWAAHQRLPLLDADGMGRAFPEMQQQSMHLAGVPACPLVLTDGNGNDIVVLTGSARGAERMARDATASLGGTSAGALYVMTGSTARSAVISGSVSKAIAVGTVITSRSSHWCQALADTMDGRLLIEGTVSELEWGAGEKFARGHAIVESPASGLSEARHVRLELQNEYLLAIEDGEVVASVPDIIAVIDLSTGVPVGTENLRCGQRIGIVVLPAPTIWATADGLAVVGPASFGYGGIIDD